MVTPITTHPVTIPLCTMVQPIDFCKMSKNKKNNGIICEQLYEKKTEEWSQGIEIFEKDYKPYFPELKTNPIMIAKKENNATISPRL